MKITKKTFKIGREARNGLKLGHLGFWGGYGELVTGKNCHPLYIEDVRRLKKLGWISVKKEGFRGKIFLYKMDGDIFAPSEQLGPVKTFEEALVEITKHEIFNG